MDRYLRHSCVICGGAKRKGKRNLVDTAQRDDIDTIPVLHVLVSGVDLWNRGISDATMGL